MMRFFVAHHVKLPRTATTKTARSRRIGHRTSTRTVNAPKRW